MVTSRRHLLVGLTALLAGPRMALAENVIDLEWGDLLPKGGIEGSPTVRGIVLHEDADLVSQQPVSTGVRTEWDGATVRLPGFVVPLEFTGEGVFSAILVPYMGACVHVPPPPANQLVLVNAEQPFRVNSMFAPVSVAGTLRAAEITTELAEVGYALEADEVRPFGA